ncbi:MAG: type II toxin-antitoxin system VapC family toxin, partial [Snowella sp.]
PGASSKTALWVTLLQRKYKVILPEIVDYEIRRELLRANKLSGLRRLDQLKSEIFYLPITTEIMLKAAELWAKARQQGKPTADNQALDGDVILASQALALKNLDYEVIIATSNKKHLSLFTEAEDWQNI